MSVENKESTLSRWSRRKLEARQPSAPEVPVGAATEAAAAEEPVAEKPELTDADMPDIDSLTEASDFSCFMSSGVSDELRNLALRKLFRSPVFNIRDGLDEYDDDFTTFEKLGDIVTSDMKHRMEIEAQKLREALAAEGEAEAAPAATADAAEANADTAASEGPEEETPAETLAAVDPGGESVAIDTGPEAKHERQ